MDSGRATKTSLASTDCNSEAPATVCNPLAKVDAIEFAWRALSSHNPCSKYASSCALTKRSFDHRCPDCLRRRSKSRARAGSKNTTASAHRAPFLVAPSDSTSTPLCQVASAGVQPRCTSALANRAPSMCTGRPCCLAVAASADTSLAWYTVPHSVAWLRLTAPGLTWCTPMSSANAIALATWSGLILPSGVLNPIILEPPAKNSGAPHSSVTMCAASWQYTAPYGGTHCASANALAAVPVVRGKIATPLPNTSLATVCNFRVKSSPPYEGTEPRLAAWMAA